MPLYLLGYGIYSLANAKYDVFPDFAPPQVTIHAEAPGLSPEQVELLVTTPVENAINGVQGIESMRSTSIQGFSAITVTFEAGSNIYLARQMIAERLSSVAGELPQGIRTPVMTPLTSSTDVVLVMGLSSDRLSPMNLRTVADWTVKRTLLSVPGVSKTAVFGGEVKQLQIQLRPEKLIKYGLSVEDIFVAARRATGIRGSGFIDNGNQRIDLKTIGQPMSPEELGRVVLLHGNGANVTLGDVANVAYGPEPAFGSGSIMGKPGVLLQVSSQYGANTLEVTRGLDKAIGDLRPALTRQGIKIYPDIFRPAGLIDTALHNVRSSLLLGAALVVVILLLFLFNFRTAAISCTAIPVSMLAAITVLGHLGYSLNTMTLGGLAIAIGEVVDDAVVDVENIFRRLRENRGSERPLPVPRVIFEASMEVRSAVVYATFAVVLVFIPVLTLSGVAGRIFAPLGIAYILAILASLGVALTATPAMCLLFLGRTDLAVKDPPFAGWLKEKYRQNILRVERRSKVVIGVTAVLIIAVLATIPFLEGEFLPTLKEGNFLVHMSAVPGTSLQESLRIGSRVAEELMKLPFVASVAQKAGRAEKSEETRGPNSSEMIVSFKPGKQPGNAMRKIREILSRTPGINYSVKTFLSERIEETISGYTAATVVNIFGNNPDIISEKAREVAQVIAGVKGAVEVRLQSPPETPQLLISLREADIAQWGFRPVDVLDAIRTAFQGNVVGQVYHGDRVFDVSVMLDPNERKAISDVGSLPLRNAQGTYVFLRQLADIREESGRYSVTHDGGRRVQTVTCNVNGRAVSSFEADARRQIASKISMPPGTFIEFTGAAEAQARSRRDLLVHSLLAIAGIVLLLAAATGNRRNLLLIILNLPFALVGGVLVALVFFGGRLQIGSMVGFVTLFGITLRNSIMLISHFEHLVQQENMTWGLETAVRGASERLVPILMTASVTAFGLLPLALGSGSTGREIEGPMALVILGGLVTSTVLNLFVLPTLALRFGRFVRRTEDI